MFFKGNKATKLQGESKDLLWSLDSKKIILVHLTLSHSWLPSHIPCLLPASRGLLVCFPLDWLRMEGRVGSGG